jgi:pentose-5-phosphate-3-epimerase
VDGGVGEANAAAVREAGATLFVAGNAVFADPDPADAYRRIAAAAA